MKKLFVSTILVFNSYYVAFTQTIFTVAGNNAMGYGFSGDGGPAISAELNFPWDIAFDNANNLYISDNTNNVIRMVNSSGIITTVVGNHAFGAGYSGDGGPASSAEMHATAGITFDVAGNLYIADYGNNVIRKVNTSGTISTVAGNYASGLGYSGDGGPATAAEFHGPWEIAVDASGNLYISDVFNNEIRMVSASGTISTVVGSYSFGNGYSGDGGPATSAELYEPGGIVFDASGNLYIADWYNYVVRKVNTSGVINTIAGNYAYGIGYSGDGGPATSAELRYPSEVAIDSSKNLYIIDFSNNVIRMVDTSGIISTVVGHYPSYGYSGDGGPATAAELWQPQGLAFDASGNLFIADWRNNVIRMVVGITTGNIQTIGDDEGIAIYPNPSAGKFAFPLPSITSKSLTEVYNLFGEKVFSRYLTNSCIDLTLQPNGVYFYRVINEIGIIVGNGKIIVDK